jgi:hypothetical protein
VVFSQFQWLILTLVRIGHVFAIRTITAVRFTALSDATYLRRSPPHVFNIRTITYVRLTAPSDAPYLRHDHLHTFRHRNFFFSTLLSFTFVRFGHVRLPYLRLVQTLHVSSLLLSTLFSFALGPDRPHLPSVPSYRLLPHVPSPRLSTTRFHSPLVRIGHFSPSVPSRQSMRSTQGGADVINY